MIYPPYETINILLFFMFIIRLLWLISIFAHFIDKKYFHNNNEVNIILLEDILHNLFSFLIGVLLIYLYNNFSKNTVCIKGEPKKYLYGFGILSCIGILQKYIHKHYFADNDNYSLL